MEGIFKNYALQGKPIEEITALEKKALGRAFADNYKKKHVAIEDILY